MTNKEEKQVKQAFMAMWLDERGTYNGWREAYDWWIDPRQECLIERAGRSNAKRCVVKCQTCTSIQFNRTNVYKGLTSRPDSL